MWSKEVAPEVIQIDDFGKDQNLIAVGFEPTPPERLEPKSSALDHSATLPMPQFSDIHRKIPNVGAFFHRTYKRLLQTHDFFKYRIWWYESYRTIIKSKKYDHVKNAIIYRIPYTVNVYTIQAELYDLD